MVNLLEALPDPMHDSLAVAEDVVHGTRHCPNIVLSFWTIAWRAGKLAVREVDSVLLNRVFHDAKVVTANLVAVASAAAVNHDCNLALLSNPKGSRGFRVENFVYFLDFQKMVA